MTTFSYTATIDDSGMIALDNAITSAIALWRAKLAVGEAGGSEERILRGYILTLEGLMKQFSEGAEMMSARGDIWDAWHKAKAERDREK
jgi:hypothetical protein